MPGCPRAWSIWAWSGRRTEKCGGAHARFQVWPRFLPAAPARSQDQPFVAFAPRDALAIQIFEQRDGVFAGNARPVFERAHVEAHGFAAGQQMPQTVDRRLVENQILADANQPLFTDQNL